MNEKLHLSPEEWQAYYNYSPERPISHIKILKRGKHYHSKQIDLHFPDHNGHREKFTLTVYESALEGRLPTILVTPIFRGTAVAQLFARYFAKQGFNAVVVHHELLQYDFSKDFGQIEVFLKKAVIRNLQTLDWIFNYEKADPGRIGTFGMSFGAIIGSIVAAIDPRPKCHIIALAGAPVADIIAKTRNRTILRLIRQEVKRREKSPKDLAQDIVRHIKTDPLHFAQHVKRDNVAMCISLFDRIVRPKCARRLWRALGKPKTIFVPFGHYSSIISFPYSGRLACRFFREKFAA